MRNKMRHFSEFCHGLFLSVFVLGSLVFSSIHPLSLLCFDFCVCGWPTFLFLTTAEAHLVLTDSNKLLHKGPVISSRPCQVILCCLVLPTSVFSLFSSIFLSFSRAVWFFFLSESVFCYSLHLNIKTKTKPECVRIIWQVQTQWSLSTFSRHLLHKVLWRDSQPKVMEALQQLSSSLAVSWTTTCNLQTALHPPALHFHLGTVSTSVT